jgi:hypothetical protein
LTRLVPSVIPGERSETRKPGIVKLCGDPGFRVRLRRPGMTEKKA